MWAVYGDWGTLGIRVGERCPGEGDKRDDSRCSGHVIVDQLVGSNERVMILYVMMVVCERPARNPRCPHGKDTTSGCVRQEDPTMGGPLLPLLYPKSTAGAHETTKSQRQPLPREVCFRINTAMKGQPERKRETECHESR